MQGADGTNEMERTWSVLGKQVDEKIWAMMLDAEELAERAETEHADDPALEGLDLVHQPLVKIGNEWIPFEERTLLDGKIHLRLPKTFHELPEEAAKLKYASERRPQLILSDESTTTNLAFNLSQTLLEDEEVEQFTEAIGELLKRTQPGATWLEQDVVDVAGRKVGYRSFIVPVVDTDLYQLMFFASCRGQALLCTFHCLKKDMEKWKSVSLGIMHSLRIPDDEQGRME